MLRATLCPFCERGPFKVVAIHTAHMHGLTAMDLRRLADLPNRASICDPEYSRQCSTADLLSGHRYNPSPEEMRTRAAKGGRIIHEHAVKRRHPCVICGQLVSKARKVCSKNCFRERRRQFQLALPDPGCEVPGCARSHACNGLCHTHDMYERRHGRGTHPDRQGNK